MLPMSPHPYRALAGLNDIKIKHEVKGKIAGWDIGWFGGKKWEINVLIIILYTL